MERFPDKLSSDANYYDFDFTDKLGESTEIVSAVVTAVILSTGVDVTSTITTVANQTIVDSIVRVWISGGTNGIDYKITCEATAVDGRIAEIEYMILVTDNTEAESEQHSLAYIINDDLDTFFDPVGGFAVTAVYTPAVGVIRNVNVIFDREGMSELGMDANVFYCEVKTVDAIAMKPLETLQISGETYKIKNPPHHKTGGTSIVELSID